jgi:probable rRNA maturation factor
VIDVDDRTGCGIPVAEVARIVEATLEAEEASGAEVGIVFADADEIRRLNREHRERDEATDVLAFPIDEGGVGLDGVPRMLGDVVVCPEVAVRQAVESAERPGTEVTELIIHGVLHLLGYDHERDEGEMLQRQDVLLGTTQPLVWSG